MPEFPFLPLPQFERGDPPRASRFPQHVPIVSKGRQGQRLGPTFNRLARVLAADHRGLSLSEDPSSIAPERALVMEISGSLNNFQAIARGVEGLEFLGEEEFEFDPDEDFFEIDKRKGKEGKPRMDRPIGGRLYLAMPDVTALKQLLSLWERWQEGKELGYGFMQWGKIFQSLRDIRPWGSADRLSNETITYWREEMDNYPNEMHRIEVEIWFRDSQESRIAAFRKVSKIVADIGGAIVHHAVLEDICYEAVLIDVPAAEILRLANREEVHLVLCDDIMFLRPQSSTDAPEPADELASESLYPDEEPVSLPPVAALLDGVPVQNHVLLVGRLEMDDPDGLEAMSLVSKRFHGTAMASLILHGDRNVTTNVLSRRLYVRPVL